MKIRVYIMFYVYIVTYELLISSQQASTDILTSLPLDADATTRSQASVSAITGSIAWHVRLPLHIE